MPKRPAYLPGGYYHIYNRGRSRLSICHDPRDYIDIIKKFKRYSRKYMLTIIAYVLLPNHYHILVRQNNRPRVTLLPQRTFNSYSKIYNLKYNHSGTIFQGPARAKLVHTERYLRHLCRYIHANPVTHGLVDSVWDWPYSNIHEWYGRRPGNLYEPKFITDHFGSIHAYDQYLTDYIVSKREPDGFMRFLEEGVPISDG